MKKEETFTKATRQKGSQWTDPEGKLVDRKRVTGFEALSDAYTIKLFNMSANNANGLVAVAKQAEEMFQKCYDMLMKENGEELEPVAGLTITNFSRTHKIERSQHQLITWDDAQMILAKKRFEEFIKEGLNDDQQIIEKIILDTFQTKRGRFDNRRVNILLGYETDEEFKKNKLFMHAIESLKLARKVTGDRAYYKVSWLQDGTWHAIPLSLAAAIQMDGEETDGE